MDAHSGDLDDDLCQGRRRVTIRDVARAANVSVATVSRALSGSETVTPRTRSHVLQIAEKLDFVPHAGAQSLSLQRTDTIGVVLPDLHGEYFSELIRGLDLGARSMRQNLLLSASHGDISEAIAALRSMRSRVDGLVVMAPFADGELVGDALKGAVPLVLLNSARSGSHAAFAVDNHAGALAVARHLLAAGHKKIAFIGGPPDNLESQERLRGFRDAHREAGVKAGPILRGNFREESGFAAATLLLLRGERPDAIFAANDAMALGCLHALKNAGIAVPGDVALAGFDDIPVARFLDPPLTTAGVPIAEMGREAVEYCVKLVRGELTKPVHKVFAPALAVRASSANKKGEAERPSPSTGRVSS
ncbi:MAG TPA: LacI family DNA-binding transcriptional regulator [Allosphingosinicella sp.]|nr:LacI family DNA-binding transcriptional regulator [Allosphingosinicella sp.]